MSTLIVSKAPGLAFPLFPTLPPELRLRIWHFALQTPHMVTLRYRAAQLYAQPVRRPLLAVNVEARLAALSVYLPGFYDATGRNWVWINPKLDTLYLDGIRPELFAKYAVVEYIERIALAVEDWEQVQGLHNSVWHRRRIEILCEHLKALKEVQIVAWDELKWSKRVDSWLKQQYPESSWEQTWHEMARRFIRARGKTVKEFRLVMGQFRDSMGFVASRKPVEVRAIALGVSGIDSSWDDELGLL